MFSWLLIGCWEGFFLPSDWLLGEIFLASDWLLGEIFLASDWLLGDFFLASDWLLGFLCGEYFWRDFFGVEADFDGISPLFTYEAHCGIF